MRLTPASRSLDFLRSHLSCGRSPAPFLPVSVFFLFHWNQSGGTLPPVIFEIQIERMYDVRLLAKKDVQGFLPGGL